MKVIIGMTETLNTTEFSSTHRIDEVTIGAGQALSNAKTVNNNTPVALLIPSGWTAAPITFAGSFDDTTFFPMSDHVANEVTIPVTIINSEDTIIRLVPSEFVNIKSFKIRSGTAASTVNQVAERIIKILTRSL